MNFGTYNTFCPQKSYDTSLLFFGANWKTRWHVYRSIATYTLRMGTSHSQGQTIRIWCTMLPTLSSLTLTNTLQKKKIRKIFEVPTYNGSLCTDWQLQVGKICTCALLTWKVVMVRITSSWDIRYPHGFGSKEGAAKVVPTILANQLKRAIVLVLANILVVCDVKVRVTARKSTSVLCGFVDSTPSRNWRHYVGLAACSQLQDTAVLFEDHKSWQCVPAAKTIVCLAAQERRTS